MARSSIAIPESLAAVASRRDDDYAFAEQAIADVKKFRPRRLDPRSRSPTTCLLDFYGSQSAFDRSMALVRGLYPISPMFGTQVQLASFLKTSHS